MTAPTPLTARKKSRALPSLQSRRSRASAAVVSAMITVLIDLVAEFTPWGQHLENGLVFGIDESRSLAYFPYEYVGLPPLRGEIPTVVVGLILVLVIAAVQRRWRELLTVGVAVPAAIITDDLLARLQVKPPLDPGVPAYDLTSSFPSGHVVIAAALSMAVLIVVPTRWVTWCAPIMLGWTALISASVLGLGWHRPSDVLGGALLVGTIFLACSALFTPKTEPVPRSQIPLLGLILTIPTVAAVFAIQPVHWGIPIFAATCIIATTITAFIALRACRTPAT